MPKDGKMKCSSCGYTQTEAKISEKKKKKEEIVVIDKKIEVLPVTDYDCKECKNGKAYFWLLQTRSSDEPETRFYKCTKCGNVSREY